MATLINAIRVRVNATYRKGRFRDGQSPRNLFLAMSYLGKSSQLRLKTNLKKKKNQLPVPTSSAAAVAAVGFEFQKEKSDTKITFLWVVLCFSAATTRNELEFHTVVVDVIKLF